MVQPRAKRPAAAPPAIPPAQRPNWVQIGTLAVALATLSVGLFTGWNAVRLTRLQAQLAEYQTRSQVIWRYVILSQPDACASLYGGKLAVMQNMVSASYDALACAQDNREVLLAGLVVEDPDVGSSLFSPRVLLDVTDTEIARGIGIWDVAVAPDAKVRTLQLGFVEEGAPQAPFVPLAILDAQGKALDPLVIRPLRMRWTSPISQEETVLELSWFRPRSEWIADGALLFAQ